MKTLMNYSAIVLLMIAFLGASTLNAQEWSKEQKAVWQEVENMWTKWKAGDIEAAFENVHENYLGWNNESPMPMSKAKWINPMLETIKMTSGQYYDIEPARILVQGNTAVVHYYFEYSFLFTKGDKHMKKESGGKWSAFFIKENGKWMLIGDMTVSEDDD